MTENPIWISTGKPESFIEETSLGEKPPVVYTEKRSQVNQVIYGIHGKKDMIGQVGVGPSSIEDVYYDPWKVVAREFPGLVYIYEWHKSNGDTPITTLPHMNRYLHKLANNESVFELNRDGDNIFRTAVFPSITQAKAVLSRGDIGKDFEKIGLSITPEQFEDILGHME